MNEQIMQALVSLRDIHEPPEPSFWPMPLGWWLLLLCLVVASVCLIWYWYSHLKQDKPYRAVRAAANELQGRLRDQGLTETEYIGVVNRLYKHVLVQLEAMPSAGRADGLQWLNLLADRFNEQDFVVGSGRCLGTVRYSRVHYFDDQLIELVQKTLCQVRHRKPGVVKS